MGVLYQKTIANRVIFEGIGIHSGKQEKVICLPQDSGFGIQFQQLSTGKIVRVGEVIPQARDYATVIERQGWSLSTVEHLLAACFVLGIDNLLLQVEGNEIPIFDGSAQKFIESFMHVGVVESLVKSKQIRVLREIQVTHKDQEIILRPSAEGELSLTVQMTRPAPVVAASYSISSLYDDVKNVCDSIMPARTFGFFEQWDVMQSKGLAQGASLESVLVWKDNAWMQPLRFANEPLRHKVLDVIGDLSLLGGFLCADVKATNPGHALHQRLIAYFFENPDAWQYY